MRVLHVITGLWKDTGGPSEVIPAICSSMVDAGMDVTLATLSGDSAQSVDDAAAHGVRVLKFLPTFRHTIWYSSELHRGIQRLAAEHDIVHIHGIWQFPDWAAAAAARRGGQQGEGAGGEELGAGAGGAAQRVGAGVGAGGAAA